MKSTIKEKELETLALPSELPDQSWKGIGEIAQPKEVEGYLVTEMFKALGLPVSSHWRAWLRPILSRFVRGFAVKAAAFDEAVSQQGFQLTAQQWLEKWGVTVSILGIERLPLDGPLLIAANHPGTYDGLAMAAIVPRQDLRIVAAGNPFFRSLPNVRKYFIYSTLDTYVRLTVIRNSLRHLQEGGALLIFPSGRLDPDPYYYHHEARNALGGWSNSLELILKKAPQTRLVIAINSKFIEPGYLKNPLLRLRSSREGRQRLAEFIQVIQQVVFDRQGKYEPGVAFSEPVSYLELPQNPDGFRNQVLARALRLLEVIPPSECGQSPARFP